MNRWNRQPRQPITSVLIHSLPAVAALLVLVLGPFVVQCRAPNGTVAPKFLFAACPPEVGCCADCEDDAAAPGANSETGFGITACGVGPCGGCTENAIFWLVSGRDLRDDASLAGPIPFLLAELHPASEATGEFIGPRLSEVDPLKSTHPFTKTYRVLRI